MKLCFPLNYVKITGNYTNSHQGIDLGWKETNTPILSCYDGIVTKIYTDQAYGGGLTLAIKYDNGYSSDFKHLSRILVREQDRVSQFQEVAIMGNSGWDTTGTHLHFNLYKDNIRINPLNHCYLYPNQLVSEKDKNKILYYEGVDNMKFSIGDKVIINGNLYASSNATLATSKVENKITEITRVAEGAKHPYNTSGDLGWMDESDIRLYQDTIDYKKLYEEEMKKSNELQEKIDQAINILNS